MALRWPPPPPAIAPPPRSVVGSPIHAVSGKSQVAGDDRRLVLKLRAPSPCLEPLPSALPPLLPPTRLLPTRDAFIPVAAEVDVAVRHPRRPCLLVSARPRGAPSERPQLESTGSVRSVRRSRVARAVAAATAVLGAEDEGVSL